MIETGNLLQDELIQRINAGAPDIRNQYMPYSRIEDHDLRIRLRVGDAIDNAAAIKGVELDILRDDWLLLNQEAVMAELSKHGQETSRRVLKEARKNVAASRLINGDRDSVLRSISDLLHGLSGCVQPPIRVVDIPDRPHTIRYTADSLPGCPLEY